MHHANYDSRPNSHESIGCCYRCCRYLYYILNLTLRSTSILFQLAVVAVAAACTAEHLLLLLLLLYLLLVVLQLYMCRST